MERVMNFKPLPLAGAYVVEPTRRSDDRGFFCRTYCAQTFREHGLADEFVQVNYSQSLYKGIIRGLHYQLPPHAEAKLVRCLRGTIQDVIVDLRQKSATFLHWHSEVLDDRSLRMMYAPPGFAHGF